MPGVIRPYRSQIVTGDILTADVTLSGAGTYVQIGSYTVPDGVAVMVGAGKLSGQDNAQGRLYFDLIDDTAGAEDGMLRIIASNPNRTLNRILFQGSTIQGRSGTADDRTSHIPVPEHGLWVPQAWLIRVELAPTAAGDVVDVSACTFLMDVTMADWRA